MTVAELLAASGPRGGIVLTSTGGPAWLSHAELARRRSDLIHLQVEHRQDRPAEVDGDIKAATGLLLGGELERRPWPLNHLLPAWDVAYGLHAAVGLLAADRHRRHTGQGRAIKLAPEDVAHAVAGHLGILAEAQLSRVHRVRIGGYSYGGFARDFGTADRERVIVAILTRRQFADLVKITRLAGTFAFLERLLNADFSACGDRYAHQASIASLLASWFARRTVADLTAAFAGTSVPWERLPSRPGQAPRAASSHPGRRLAAVGGWP
jgi:2-methylfumaryl-CoA isomerase